MREVGLPAVEGCAEPGGSARLSTAARFSRVLSTDSSSGPRRPVGSAALRARPLDVVEGNRGRTGAWLWLSRRRGCGCATGAIGCSTRCRCGSCPRRGTGRLRCAGGGCRWCRCWTNRTAAGVRGVWPRRPLRRGAVGNGGGTEVGEARGRDEQRPDAQRLDVQRGVRVAAGSGGGGAQRVGVGAVEPGRGRRGRCGRGPGGHVGGRVGRRPRSIGPARKPRGTNLSRSAGSGCRRGGSWWRRWWRCAPRSRPCGAGRWWSSVRQCR
jgi:hypothetical protein